MPTPVTPDTLTAAIVREQLAIERTDGNWINVDICHTALGRTRGAGQVVTFQLGEVAQAKQLVCDAINARAKESK